MNRRHFLEIAGTAGYLGATGTRVGRGKRPQVGTETQTPDGNATQTSSGTETQTSSGDGSRGGVVSRRGITFDRVVNAVEDLGMDPKGEVPIDDALDKAYRDGTLILFPPGEYLAAESHNWDDNVARFGMFGLGESRGDVEFVFPPGNVEAENPANYWFLRVQSGRDHLLENVTIQQTRDEETGVGMFFNQEDGLRVVDVELAGFNPAWSHDPGFGLIAAITKRDGVGIVRRFTCVGGGVIETYPKRKTPIGSFENHRGELRILEPHIEESGSHSVYVSRTNGCVRIEDGLFKNNDNTNLRMSGGNHPSKRSWVKNCEIVIDIESAEHLPSGEQYQGCRGIWIESAGEDRGGYTDLLVENLSAAARTNASPLPLMLIDHSHGAVTVRNSVLRSSVNGVAPVLARSPKRKEVREPYAVTFDGVDVRTKANYTTTGYAVALHGRQNSTLRNLTVTNERRTVSGILVSDSGNSSVVGADVAIESSRQAPRPLPDSNDPIGETVGLLVWDSANVEVSDCSFDLPPGVPRVLRRSPDSGSDSDSNSTATGSDFGTANSTATGTATDTPSDSTPGGE